MTLQVENTRSRVYICIYVSAQAKFFFMCPRCNLSQTLCKPNDPTAHGTPTNRACLWLGLGFRAGDGRRLKPGRGRKYHHGREKSFTVS